MPPPRRLARETGGFGRTALAFGLGVVVTLLVLVLGAYGAVELGVLPANADAKPSSLEEWAAHTSLHRAISRDDAILQPPAAVGNGELSDGVKLYAANCAVCHGASDGKPSILAQGFYIPAPQLASDGVEDDPVSETFWKLKHGIRFTAMPSFGGRLTDDQLWRITEFVKVMDALPPPVEVEWKAVKSAARTQAKTASPATPDPAKDS